MDLNKEEHLDAIASLVCYKVRSITIPLPWDCSFVKLPIQTLIQLMKKMPKDERLVDAAKKALDFSDERVKINIYDCLLKWDESIEDVVQHAEPSFLQVYLSSNFWLKCLKLLAKNGKNIDFVKTKIDTLLTADPLENAFDDSPLSIYLEAMRKKTTAIDLLIILIQRGFTFGEEREILENLKAWVKQTQQALPKTVFSSSSSRWGWDEENKEHYDIELRRGLEDLSEAILASEKRRRQKRSIG